MNINTARFTLYALVIITWSVALSLPSMVQEATPEGPVLFTNVLSLTTLEL